MQSKFILYKRYIVSIANTSPDIRAEAAATLE